VSRASSVVAVPARRASGGVGRLRLRPGPQGLQREHVSDIQRARMLAAMTLVAGEQDVGEATVAHVVERAGVSRRTFYELFTDIEQCLLKAIEDGIGRARARVLDAYDPAAPWAKRIRAGLIALLELFDEEPPLARLLIVESLARGQRTLQYRRQALEPLIAALEEGRKPGGSAGGPPALTGEALIGGALGLLHAHITSADPEPLLGLTNQLMSLIVLPYQGAGAARRELSRPAPSPTRRAVDGDGVLRSDPFKDAGMRLTYRTMRVLEAVAEQPGFSNKRIAEHAQISDQGQISKLLSRLERLGLVVNDGDGQSRGAPNAWTLTASGRQVTGRLHAHTQHPSGERRDPAPEVHRETA
jgi:AcrR family transcriptional regulator/DNA-binding MarR family transcriptional regulator